MDFTHRYLRQKNSRIATPEMIRQAEIGNYNVSDALDRISFEDLPQNILDVLSPGGMPNFGKIDNFLKDANAALDAKFSKDEILGMDPENCINRRGRINRGRLNNSLGIEKENF